MCWIQPYIWVLANQSNLFPTLLYWISSNKTIPKSNPNDWYTDPPHLCHRTYSSSLADSAWEYQFSPDWAAKNWKIHITLISGLIEAITAFLRPTLGLPSSVMGQDWMFSESNSMSNLELPVFLRTFFSSFLYPGPANYSSYNVCLPPCSTPEQFSLADSDTSIPKAFQTLIGTITSTILSFPASVAGLETHLPQEGIISPRECSGVDAYDDPRLIISEA